MLNDSGAVAFAVVPDRPTLADDNAAAADRWATAADRYVRIHDDAVESSGVRATVLVPRVPSADEERASPPLWPAASLEPYASPRPDDGAILIYTSGTTGQPKGALHTHVTLEAQCDALRAAWGWRRDDRILHALPLHITSTGWSTRGCARTPPAPSLSSVRTRRVSHRVPRGSVSAKARNVARRSPCSWGCPRCTSCSFARWRRRDGVSRRRQPRPRLRRRVCDSPCAARRRARNPSRASGKTPRAVDDCWSDTA